MAGGRYSMNDLMRGGGRGSATGVMPDDSTTAGGSRDFTVQKPGTHSPDDAFTYEPLLEKPGAWAVYPPGVPCDPEEFRISRNTPADVGDFDKMQSALDDAQAGTPEEGETPTSESGEAAGDTGDAGAY
jgi:hypothetical protein